jgi:hypothetical protein
MIRTSLTLLATLTLGGTTSAQFVMMTNATLDTLVTFSPVDGSIITQNLFAIPNTTQVSAIDVNGEIWISEQTGDRVVRYDLAGNVLGQMGPTFAGGGLDNIRGMAYVNGLVYVTNGERRARQRDRRLRPGRQLRDAVHDERAGDVAVLDHPVAG